jgi:diaminobutyrate-2-oxoglutarate transaminase
MLNSNATMAEPSEFDRSESAVRYYCREMPAVFEKALNARIWDENGGEYIDFLSACGSLNYGHNHPFLKSRVMDYLGSDGMLNGLDLHTVAKRDFVRTFREKILAPRGLSYRLQFPGPTGTNAVEAALKLARKVTGRRSVVAFSNAFHGMTLGALALTGNRNARLGAGVPLDDVVRLPFQGYLGADASELDRYAAMVEDPSGGIEPPAAFIVEMVQGEGGLNVADADWVQHLARVAKRLGALLIIDDIQAGCGRTGAFFGFERAGIDPDIVCLSKSLSGIGLPMSLVLIAPEHDQWAPGEHNGTFRGNNLAFVAATAALELWQSPEFSANAAAAAALVESWVAKTARALGKSTATPRGMGMMSGLAFSDERLAGMIAHEAFSQRMLIETAGPHGEVLKLMPPLTIETDLLQEGLQRLDGVVAKVVSQVGLAAAA